MDDEIDQLFDRAKRVLKKQFGQEPSPELVVQTVQALAVLKQRDQMQETLDNMLEMLASRLADIAN